MRPVQEEKIAEKEKEKIHVADYIGLIHQSEQQLEQAFKDVAEHHKDELMFILHVIYLLHGLKLITKRLKNLKIITLNIKKVNLKI